MSHPKWFAFLPRSYRILFGKISKFLVTPNDPLEMIDLEITWILGPFILRGPPPEKLCQVTHCPNVKDPCVLSHSALRLSSQMPVKRHIPPVSFLGSQRKRCASTASDPWFLFVKRCVDTQKHKFVLKKTGKVIEIIFNQWGSEETFRCSNMMCSHATF